MAIAPQQFGVISTEDGKSEAMLCMDADRPDEMLIQWWGEKPSAILFKMVSAQNDSFELSPMALYRISDIGALWAPSNLSPEEIERVKGLHVLLRTREETLEGEWTHSSGLEGSVRFNPLPHSPLVEPKMCSTWADFKEWASWSRGKMDAVAYRGHGSSKFKLQTTLHRAGRNRLERYCADTLQEFRGHVEAELGERIDMNNGADYSMVLGLAQHHGLPTPLLDLTGSPYVAAFFAFADAFEFAEMRPDVSHVRVYGMTRAFLSGSSTLRVTLPYFKPYTSSLSISPRKNPRLYAQQGQFLVTNVGDVEPFICAQERKMGTQLLIAADVPVGCALEALEDLAFMGLTAATMFPGLDGVCRMMKHTMSFRRRATPPAPKPEDGGRTEPPQETPVAGLIETDGESAN